MRPSIDSALFFRCAGGEAEFRTGCKPSAMRYPRTPGVCLSIGSGSPFWRCWGVCCEWQPSSSGTSVPLGQVAKVVRTSGPGEIASEDGLLRVFVHSMRSNQTNLRWGGNRVGESAAPCNKVIPSEDPWAHVGPIVGRPGVGLHPIGRDHWTGYTKTMKKIS